MPVRDLRHLILGLLGFLTVGCGTTAINESHPLVASDSLANVSSVYFIRPDSGFEGVRGNAFTVSLGGQDLLTLAKGEYTLVYLEQYAGEVTVSSSTVEIRNGKNTQVTVKESRPFLFDGSAVYSIGFEDSPRGFVPQSITDAAARKMASQLKPVGMAVDFPL